MSKKFAIVLGLALVIVMASVSMAYAAANSGYAAWNPALPGNGTTPHKNYTTTTVKCAVCHAVHKANAGGELLLMGTAGNSCEFCHISDSIGLVRIYNGAAANYNNPTGEAHNNIAPGATVGSRCSDCHATHGANTMTDVSVDKFILKTSAAYTLPAPGTSGQQAEAAAALVAGDKNTQIDAFCSMCHPYFQTTYGDGVAGNGDITVAAFHAGGTLQTGAFQSHIMGAANLAYGNSKATYSGQVAWAESSHCRSCHDGGLVDQQSLHLPPALPGTVIVNSFPHYTPDYTRFLISKGFATDAAGNTNYLPTGTTSNNMPDGVCLKCHRNNAANTGIGFAF